MARLHNGSGCFPTLSNISFRNKGHIFAQRDTGLDGFIDHQTVGDDGNVGTGLNDLALTRLLFYQSNYFLIDLASARGIHAVSIHAAQTFPGYSRRMCADDRAGLPKAHLRKAIVQMVEEHHGSGQAEHAFRLFGRHDSGELLTSLVFKIATDPYVGKLFFVRVYGGTLKKGANAYNPRTKKRERIMKIVRLFADDQIEVDELKAGDIGAVVGLKDCTTGDTLCAEMKPCYLERITAPQPVMFLAIEPKSSADKDKLVESMYTLAAEDPTCQVREDEETGQTILSGMGELHLEILVDRLKREFKCAANVGKPMVSYVETVTAPATTKFSFDRELGGKRHAVTLTLAVKPLERGEGVKIELSRDFRNTVADKHLQECVEQGLKDGIATGVLARYPMTDLAVECVAAEMVDMEISDEVAFRSAAVMGFREAAENASPEFLEPIMKLEITTPPESVGEVLGDLNSRRGTVLDMSQRGDMQLVHARVPLAKLFGYATSIRSLTKGRASYSMEPDMFDIAPKNVREEILSR